MRKTLLAITLVVLIPLAGACASAGTPKPADRPDLLVPSPPPHVIPITPEPVIEPVAEVPAPAASGTSRPAARPAAPRPAASDAKSDAKTGEARPETPVVEAPAPTTPTPPPAPAPQLRTTESATAEAGIRSSLERTKNLLNSVDYRRLSAARKRAYDDAKRFSQQAEDALKAGNAVFAQNVAAKAETLAKELAGG